MRPTQSSSRWSAGAVSRSAMPRGRPHQGGRLRARRGSFPSGCGLDSTGSVGSKSLQPRDSGAGLRGSRRLCGGRMNRTAAVIATAAAVIVALSTGAAVRSARAAMRPCGTITASGKTWTVSAVGVTCSQADGLARQLAPKATSNSRLGTFLGLRCTGLGAGSNREVACVAPDGRNAVYVITHS
jgi:hypothetical protein